MMIIIYLLYISIQPFQKVHKINKYEIKVFYVLCLLDFVYEKSKDTFC